MTRLFYNKNLKSLSKELRAHSTLGEVTLWKYLRAKQVCGMQFNRQKPIGNYIVDFYCKKACLVIEIDGYSHSFSQKRKRDMTRQRFLEKMNLTVLRFSETEVLKEIDQVLKVIESFLVKKTNPPNPL